jgi:hypothetical protein
MDDAEAPPPEEPSEEGSIYAIGDTVVIRAVVRLISKDECYLQVAGISPRWQFWIPVAEIAGRSAWSRTASFAPGDRVKLTGTVVSTTEDGVTLAPDHAPIPRPSARMTVMPGYLALIDV